MVNKVKERTRFTLEQVQLGDILLEQVQLGDILLGLIYDETLFQVTLHTFVQLSKKNEIFF